MGDYARLAPRDAMWTDDFKLSKLIPASDGRYIMYGVITRWVDVMILDESGVLVLEVRSEAQTKLASIVRQAEHVKRPRRISKLMIGESSLEWTHATNVDS